MLLRVTEQPGNGISRRGGSLERWLGTVRSRSGDLVPSERRVVDLVLADPLFVGTATTAQVAERAGVSAPSVVRAARAIGYDGFAGLKVAIARARGSADFFAPPAAIGPDASMAEVLGASVAGASDALAALAGALDSDTAESAVRAISGAGQLLAFGAGPSATVAADVVFRFRALGIRTAGAQDHESAMIAARLMAPGDVMVLVSSTGRTTTTLAVADAAAGAGATVIAVTNQYGTPLAESAELVLAVGGPALTTQMAAAGSRLAHLTVVDVLAAMLVVTEPERRRTAELAGVDLPDIF